jgi:hypothetical protein
VASIVGIPTKEQVGSTNRGDQQLGRHPGHPRPPDMQFRVQRNMAGNADEPVPTCISAPAPAARPLHAASSSSPRSSATNGLVTSICEPSYENTLKVIVDRIAAQLQGQ